MIKHLIQGTSRAQFYIQHFCVVISKSTFCCLWCVVFFFSFLQQTTMFYHVEHIYHQHIMHAFHQCFFKFDHLRSEAEVSAVPPCRNKAVAQGVMKVSPFCFRNELCCRKLYLELSGTACHSTSFDVLYVCLSCLSTVRAGLKLSKFDHFSSMKTLSPAPPLPQVL